MRLKKNIILLGLLSVFALGQFVLKGGYQHLDFFSDSYALSEDVKNNLTTSRGQFAADLSAVRLFDELTKDWIKEYKRTQGHFAIEPLAAALELLPLKGKSAQALSRAKILWKEGNIESVDVLVSSLIFDFDIPLSEIEAQFGKKIAIYVSDLKKRAELDVDFMSEGAKVVTLADELYRLRENKGIDQALAEEGAQSLKNLCGTNNALEKEISRILN